MSAPEFRIQEEDEPRLHYLAQVARLYILAYAPDDIFEYDNAICDGTCLAEELGDALEVLGVNVDE